MYNLSFYETIERSEYYLQKSTNRSISDIFHQFKETTTHLQVTEKFAPHLLEETRGVADGCGIDFDRIFAYQCNEEILRHSHSSHYA